LRRTVRTVGLESGGGVRVEGRFAVQAEAIAGAGPELVSLRGKIALAGIR
jgi:hypothetical protein